jgi:hypothetical protein
MTQSPVQRSLWVGLGAFLNFVGQSWVGVRQPDSLRAIVAGQKRVSVIIPIFLIFILIIVAFISYGLFSFATLFEIWIFEIVKLAFISLVVSAIGRVSFYNLAVALLSVYWFLEAISIFMINILPVPISTTWSFIALPLAVNFYAIKAVPDFKLHTNANISFALSGLLMMCLFGLGKVLSQFLG